MRRSFVAIVPIAIFSGWILSLCAPAGAQDAVINQMYGNGVHAYFSQEYVKAHQCFTSAIDAHSQDPRCFYFRGLTDSKLGRPQDAEFDFKEGAKLETNVDPARSYGVARSLERIQGPERATLEQFRLEARAAILKKDEEQNRVRYEVNQRQTRDFLDSQAKGAGTDKVVPDKTGAEKADLPAPAKAGNADPFNPSGAAAPEMKKDDGAAKPETPPTPPADADKPAEPPTPPAEKPAEGPKAAPGDDPFGTKATPDKAPPAAAPAAEPAAPKAEGADPFAAPAAGAPAPKKADAKPADAKPADAKSGGAAADAADPFGAAAATPAAPAKGDAAPAKDDAAPAAPPAKDDAAPAAPAAPAKKDAPPAKDADPFG